MWIVTGPFDTEVGADLSFQKSKLLKTGQSYPLGRKDRALSVGSKKVSHDHCEFNVGRYSLDDVYVPDKRPSLEFLNKRDKGMRLTRGDAQLVVGPNSSLNLQDGDVISIVTGLPIAVKWVPLCCYLPRMRGKSLVPLETCAALGIPIVYEPNPLVTHHIIPTYVATASVAASLISLSQFVKLEWLSEVLRLGSQPKNDQPSAPSSLEDTFVLPLISKYRPSFSPSLNPSQKVFKAWEPNEERMNMFANYRFLCIGEKTREMESDLRELIKRGSGYLETFDVSGGVSKLHRALTRGQAKENQQLIVVADARDMKTVVGSEDWKKLVEEVKSFGLDITHPDAVVQAVLNIDTSLLTTQPSLMGTNAGSSNVSSLPSYIPNSIPDEPSIIPNEPSVVQNGPATPRKRLLRRANSRQPSAEPTPPPPEPEAQQEASKRRLVLSRRSKTVEPPTPNADSRIAPENPPEPVAEPTIPPTPNRPRLKRRLGAAAKSATAESVNNAATTSQLPDLSVSGVDEPPLKKFRALFEASDPSRNDSGSADVFGNEDANTQTQTQTQASVARRAFTSNLSALREEEEESQTPLMGPSQRGTKRPLVSIEDVEMAEVENEIQPPAAKRQALENINSVERTTTTFVSNDHGYKGSFGETATKERNPGAPLGKPDTDAEFLKALASTKKGKRSEDLFDKEFNQLRISKPEINRQEREEEWKVLADFGDDTGLRGNFMVVMEMEIHRKDSIPGQPTIDVPPEWVDRANFKKFKKKSQGVSRPSIELFVSEDNEFDAATTHWKARKSQKHPTSTQSQMDIRNGSQPSLHSTKSQIIIGDDDEENEPPRLGKTPSSHPVQAPSRAASRVSSHYGSKPPLRASSVVPLTRSVNSRTVRNKQALFLDSDDDIKEVEEPDLGDPKQVDGDDDDEQTLRSSNISKPSNKTKAVAGVKRKATAIIVDDDSDDGAVFKGFGSRKRAR